MTVTFLGVTPHVESNFNFTRKLETVNVFPGSITVDGWENAEGLYEQSVSDTGLFQTFSRSNSTYVSHEDEGGTPIFDERDVPIDQPGNATTDLYFGSENESSPSSDVQGASDDQIEDAAPIESKSESTEIESEPSVPQANAQGWDIFGFFRTVRDHLPFAEETIIEEHTSGEFRGDGDTNELSSEDGNVDELPETTDLEKADETPQVEITEVSSEGIDESLPEVTTPPPYKPSSSPGYITMSDFGIPPLASGQFITNVQLRMSLGAQIVSAHETPPQLFVEYSFDAIEWQEAGTVLLDAETSNAINGGYFLLALPRILDPKALSDLRIRIHVKGELTEDDTLFLDAAWLEVDTEIFDKELLRERLLPEALTDLTLPSMHTILSDTLDFARTDSPVFVLRYESQRSAAIRLLRSFFDRTLAEVASVTVIRKDVGVVNVTPVIDMTKDGLWTIQMPDMEQEGLEPGTYAIEITVNEGGKRFTDVLEFQWGLLAQNPNKSEYEIGETALFSLAALSPSGNTLCDANLALYVIDPVDFIYPIPITRSGLCNGNNVIDVPDYSASFTPTVPGTYEMYLEHVGEHGEVRAHALDTFIVKETQALSIERTSMTRIYPRAPYVMTLTVTSDEGYEGTLIEPVPSDFTIVETDGQIISDGSAEQEIRWSITIPPQGAVSVSYTYDAPDISPFLYTLGPARLTGERAQSTPIGTSTPEAVTEEPLTDDTSTATASTTESFEETAEETVESNEGEGVFETETQGADPNEAMYTESPIESIPLDDPGEAAPEVPEVFETVINDAPLVQASIIEQSPNTTFAFVENRAWQIASDATGSMIVFWTSGASIPSGWTCISCTATSTFYQRFPLGGGTYGTQGGTPTTTHTADGTVNQATGVNTENNSSQLVNIESHTHTITPSVAASSTLPAYRQLRVIQNNSAGTPATIPAGAILIFDGTLPSGWAQYTPLDNRYPYGENTIVSAGTSTHTHTVTGTTTAAAGSTYLARTTGTTVTAALSTHTHTLNASTTAVNHEPPYIEVIFATSSVATATPLSAIAMWSDSPPAGWLDRSSNNTKPFYNRYIKGSSTYGTTGGSETHTHSNFSASSSAPVGTGTRRTGSLGANGTHQHLIDVSNFSTASNTPPYVTVIYGKYFGLVPIFDQSAFRWYTNTNSVTVSDPWPTSTLDIAENEALDSSFTALKNGDVIRLRLQLRVENSTTTGEDFKLQYGTTTSVCTAVGTWTDVGSSTSSAHWIGYNNASPADGATLATSTLTGTDVLESYEEQNPTVVLPNQIGINKEGEWDFVLKQNSATPATNYCFRMIESDGTELFSYTQYPMLVTDQSPSAPTLDLPFNNEKVATTTPYFEFSGTDPEADDLTYQIQIDDDFTFGSVNVDRNTASNPTEFSNETTFSDKDPYNQGELIRFTLPAASSLTNGATYYWRVRATDPSGSNAYGNWSTTYSFTVDTSVTVSTWFQTTEEQFDTDTLVGTDALVTDRVQLITGSTTGTTTSSDIDFLDGTTGNAWGSLSWVDDETVGDIKYRIQFFNESTQTWSFIPDATLSGNAAGFDSSPVSLLGLDTDTYRLLRINAIFTNSGGTPTLFDWTVSFGYRIETVTQEALFPNEKSGTTTPTFVFYTTDPQSDDLVYELQWSTAYDFAASTTRSSDIHLGFTNITNGGDTSPFSSGNTISFTVQAADVLTNGTTYWWRVRARDPLGSNQYSLYTDPISFTVDTTVTVSTWFQTTQSQFDTDVLSGTTALVGGSVTVATTSDESLVVYAEGNITTPRYREWDGTTWSAESSALDVGGTVNWIIVRSSPNDNEYVMGTLDTNADVNVQVFKNGSWSNLTEITTSVSNAGMRAFDIAYEQDSGDAIVVSCDGDADPLYYVWNGTNWTNGGGLSRVNSNTCGWVKLISDPTSDEIIAVIRDVAGIRYEARVWNGSAWGNSTLLGSMNQTSHEGIAAEYEESGNQAVVVTSNGTASNFAWREWNGTSWSLATNTQTIGDDFEAGMIAADEGTDNMVLCYVDEDGDIGTVRWNGSAWQTTPASFTELDTGWTTVSGVYNDRPIECAYEVGGSRDGFIMAAYASTTGMAYRAWNGATWSTAAAISSIQDSPRVQVRRTGANLIQVLSFDNTNDRYDYSGWNGTSWSTFQTLETDGSVGASPYKEPFMIAERKPGITGSAVVSPEIDFYDGAGPYWQQLSWTDSEPGGSSILYQVEYYDGDSWELVPNSLIPGNSTGTSSSPINLANVLPVSTYSLLRPVANLTCNLGTCPSLSDWTVTWAAGITISGTAFDYAQTASTTSGTVNVALNGVLQTGKTGTISNGSWSIANVNASPGDVITVFVNGANDANEAVAVARYDGVGDISGMTLYERHLTLGSNDATSTPFTNADLGLYDTTNDEDLFYDVTNTTLTICGDVGCGDAEVFIKSASIYRPGGTVNTHDIEINGTFRPEGNTIYVSGSWDNNATSTSATSTIVFTATSTSETLDETGALSPSFYNLTFGTTTGNATWTPATNIDVNNTLTVSRGTVVRSGVSFAVGGTMSIGANGFLTGVGTTTFDGSGTANYIDANSTPQNAGRVVVDGTSKTVQLASAMRAQSVSVGADDILDVSTANYGLTVLESFNNGNTFIARNGTVTFVGTTTNLTVTAGGDAFYNLTFNGSGGGWSFSEAALSVSNDFVISTGTVTLPSGTTTIAGSFTNTGTFAHNNATVDFTSTNADTITLSGTPFTNAFYNTRFSGGGSWSFTEAHATTSNDLRISAGAVTFPSNTLTVVGNFENTGGSFSPNNGTVRFSGTVPKVIDTNSAFYNILFTRSTTTAFVDTNVSVLEDITVNAGEVVLPPGTLTVGGSFINTGVITPNGGTILMNSSDTGESISFGQSTVNTVTINSSTGGWTIVENATTSGAFTLASANSFTLASGKTLAVGGTFTNSVGGASTTWTGSVLSLEAGAYSLNGKTVSGDAYETLRIKANTDIAMWNSSATLYLVDATGSLYSQDHAGVDGDLYIFGNYERSSGTEYWSYATDFDGTSLGTTSRQVDVRFASGASAAFSTSTLSIVGAAAASTTIANQGSGTYTVSVTAGTTTALYYGFSDLGSAGLSLLGGTKVTSLTNGRFVPAVASGSGITVSAQTIDANPGLQIYRAEFSTTTAISAANVTQNGGTPTSYWWFRESTGNIDGESFDSDSGDPGSIRWDDSLLSITISGTVYQADGVTPMGAPTCGVGSPVRVVVEGGSSYDGSCNGSGFFSIPGVTIVGDPTVTVFLNSAAGGQRAVTLTKTPTADITSFDLIQNRVIVRHEDASAMTIDDMLAYDGIDDSDIPFTAATGTLTAEAGFGLVVHAGKTFAPGGVVTLLGGGTGTEYDGSLYLRASSTFIGAGTTTYSIGGSWFQYASSSFVGASSTVFMTATTTGKTFTSSSSESIALHNLTFSGANGGWNLNGNMVLTGDIALSAGTLTGSGNITLTNGSFSGNGILSLGSGTTTLTSSNTLGGTQPWTFANLVLGTGSITGTTTKATTATTTVSGKLTISTGHYFMPYGSLINLTGSGTVFVENGTFVESTSTVRYGGTGGSSVLSTTYHNLVVNAVGGSPTYTGTGLGIVVQNDLTIGGSANTTFTLDTNDPAFDVNGNISVAPNGTFVGSNSASLTAGGNWDNDGTFTGSGGTVTFDGTGTHTIAAGNSPWSNVVASSTGTLTITEHATTTSTFILNSADTFTVNSGISFAVGGAFSNNLGGGDTVWTGSTLHLYGGGNYQINSPTTTDTYARLAIGASTQIRMWNSDASTYDLVSSASLYSQDHANVAGDLAIYGAYVKTSGTDHWSYATDFDGTSLGGSSRQVDVRIASGASVLYQGGGLAIIGTAAASTTVANQGSGSYSMRIGGNASTTMLYYEFSNLDASGLTFSGTPSVTTLSNGTFVVGAPGGTAITVGGTVITQNPARTFTENTFSTSTSGTLYNVTATGTTVSSWRFTNHHGTLDGEAYDQDPDGDPGYIVWDDSAALLTLSGRVYQDEGSTASGVCDSSTQNIVLRVAGLTTYQAWCIAGTGSYTIPNVSYSPGDSFVIWIDGEVEKAAIVSEDPVTNISNLDLYENRVIVRHEGSDPLSIADMSLWDSSDDADIPFTAVDSSPDTLSLPANRKLLIWTGKEFEPGGNVTVSGGGGGAMYDGTLELQTNATFDATGSESHSIGGSLIMGTGATFDDETSTVTFTTSGAARTIDSNDQSFYNLVMSGSGSWTVTNAALDIGNDLTVAQGALTLPSGTTTIAGSFQNTGGSFVQNGGWVAFTSAGAESIRMGGGAFGTTTFSGGGTFTYQGGTGTTTGDFTILAGTVVAPTGTLMVGGDFTNNGTYTHSGGTLRMTSGSASTTINASSSDLANVTIAGSGTFLFTDSTEALTGSLILLSGTTTLPTSVVSIGGSLISAGGAFIHATGTALFNSSDTGESITPGSSTFTNLTISAPSGGYTITGNATTTGNFTLSGATSFTLQSGSTLSVSGLFTNLVGGAATTWTGTTIALRSGTNYTVNTKAAGGDTYNIVTLNNNTDLRLWNSSATTTLLDTSSSLYSQNNAAINGELYIYGDYRRTTGADYWSATTDFDGTALSSRAVTVRHQTGATSTFSGGTLEIIGSASATTTITNQGSGTYSLQVTGGSLNAQYYAIRNIDTYGLVLTGETAITSLQNGDLELAVSGGALITVSSTTLNYNASAVISGMRFATTTAISGVNVALIGTTPSAWTFTSHRGNLAGEAFDSDGIDDCGSIRWSDSTCLLTEESAYRWRNDDGGEGVPNSEWFDVSWTKRKRITVTNLDATEYTNAVVEVTVPYDSDMQSDFDDLRITSANGTTPLDFVREQYTASTEAVLWVEVPTLPTSAETTLYVYYGNGGATYGGVGTTTFIAYDDFEDNNITEYVGDTTLFTTDTTFAYQGTYGLEAANTGGRTTDGIYRTSASSTVSQGQSIRFLQYVDTSAGSADETCTMFGVQSNQNNNYAVCLEQVVGTDRLSISRGVDDNDLSGTVLASTSVAYTTGWYEVEVAWGTNNNIAVSLSKDDVLVATTSATDSTYTTGGFGFTFWFQNGGWDFFTARPLLTTEPTTTIGYEQVPGGATWAAALNTGLPGVTVGEVVRPRFLIENTGLTVSDQYRLMFAEKGSSPSCEAVTSGSYSAVPPQASCGTSPLCMQTSTQFTNNAGTTDVLGGDGTFTPGEIIESPSNTTNAISLDPDEYTEVEYAIVTTINADEPTYCLRVSDAGTAIDSYTKVAELSLTFEPNVTSLIFNGGADITLTPGTTTRVYATGTVTDQNGYADIVAATTTFFQNGLVGGVGYACSANNNNCYRMTGSSCSFTNCSGNSCNIVCSADMYYFANPTDIGTYAADTWTAALEVRDQGGIVASSTSSSIDLVTLRALTADNLINYGSLSVTENTGAYNATTTFENIGNDAIDVLIEGTNLTDGLFSSIPVNEQIFATSTFTYSACTYCTQLTASSSAYELDLAKPTTTVPGVLDAIYWGIEIPFGVSANPHTGTNIFYATGDN